MGSGHSPGISGYRLSECGVPSVWALLEEGQDGTAPRGLCRRPPLPQPVSLCPASWRDGWSVCRIWAWAQALLGRLLQSLA